MNDLHTCSYHCDRPECIKAQRDELRDRIAAAEADLTRYREGYKGACYACEAVGEKNVELEDKLTERVRVLREALELAVMRLELFAYDEESEWGYGRTWDEIESLKLWPPEVYRGRDALKRTAQDIEL